MPVCVPGWVSRLCTMVGIPAVYHGGCPIPGIMAGVPYPGIMAGAVLPCYAPWWVLYSLLCTMVGVLYPGIMVGVLYPGIMVGIHLPAICPGYPGGYTPPCYMPRYTPWVHPPSLRRCWCDIICPTCSAVCGRKSPGLKEGGFPWVGGFLPLKVVNPVEVGGSLCAELLRSPRMKE